MGEVGFGFDAGEANFYREWRGVGGCLAVLKGGLGIVMEIIGGWWESH